ncbi:MAG: TnpV protein, partial [Oscillospiraceae bacterium]|nr:TnpV protein [Oscillospiraceae bacterium]
GQRHLRFIKKHRHSLYLDLLMTGKLNSYLADIDHQAEDMLLMVMEEMAENEDITEQLKAENQIEWITKMNNAKHTAIEIINNILIYA